MIDATRDNTDVKLLLSARRREVHDDVHARLRDERTDRAHGAGDDIDHADARTRGDMDLALIQMRSDTLTRIDAALVQIDAGQYGSCFECGGAIAERRLQALPFAVRCRDCEDQREQEHLQQARRASGVSAVPDPAAMFVSRVGRHSGASY
jgi:DnaK suppressor protein